MKICSYNNTARSWRRICKGRDLQIAFTVEVANLVSRDLTLEVIEPQGTTLTFNQEQLDIMGQNVQFELRGIEQHQIGVHAIRLWDNKDRQGQNILDFTNAFELVRTTEEESEAPADSPVTISVVDFSTSGQGGGGTIDPDAPTIVRYKGEVDDIPEDFATAIMALTSETSARMSLENERVGANKYYLYAVKTATPVTFEIYNAGGGQIAGFEGGSVTINGDTYSYALVPASTMPWRFNIYPINN